MRPMTRSPSPSDSLREPTPRPDGAELAGRALVVYLLGELDFDEFVAFQRRLAYDVGGGDGGGALVLCHHPPGVTVGREGSRVHVRPGPEELHASRWPVRTEYASRLSV